MAKMVFVNLPVTDVARSVAFYEAIGATRDPAFSTVDTAMMLFSDTIRVMLLHHDRFRDFTSRPVADPRAATGMLLCLSEDSRASLDATMARARAAGADDFMPPQDHGFMYGRSFEDPDGHVIELVWMDVDAAMAAGGPGTGDPA